jgi:hypothetical protein
MVPFCRYENDIDAYRENARACVLSWRDRIYDPPPSQDPHYPTFSPYEASIHEPVRTTMIAEAKKQDVRKYFKLFYAHRRIIAN